MIEAIILICGLGMAPELALRKRPKTSSEFAFQYRPAEWRRNQLLLPRPVCVRTVDR
jgi:hypothetical protein